MKNTIPGLLWIAIISLGLMVVGKVGFAFTVGPLILVDAALTGVLLLGIIMGHRWAYILTLVLSVIGTISGLSKGLPSGIAVLVLDCLVLVPVLLCTSYFFPKRDSAARNEPWVQPTPAPEAVQQGN